MAPRTVWSFNFTGWILFTVSAVFFTWGTWRAGDVIGILASLAFLVACICFIVLKRDPSFDTERGPILPMV